MNRGLIEPWPLAAPGVIVLPSGRRVRGRSLRGPVPSGPLPTLAVQLTRRQPPQPPWERQWIQWRDFWVPADPVEACAMLRNAYERTGTDRVEIACGGGVGRTGTGLAALAALPGRIWTHTRPSPGCGGTTIVHAVEVPWQWRFLRTVASTTKP